MAMPSRPKARLLFSLIRGAALSTLLPSAGLQGSEWVPSRSAHVQIGSEVRIQAESPIAPATPPDEASAPTNRQPFLSVAECIQIALERQPAVAAARSDLGHGGSPKNGKGCEGDQKSKGGGILKGLAIRRQQATLGSAAATAALDVAERETVYAVTRTYFTAVYAREQRDVVERVVKQLSDSLGLAERFLGKPDAPRDLNKNAVGRNAVFLRLAQARLVDAEQGMLRAKAALREAMGVGPDFCFEIPLQALPEPDVKACKEEIVALAISRRGEMAQAAIGEQVCGLEVQAQEHGHGIKKLTFAAAADLHSHPVPAGVADGEYRPGALGLEMPVYLIGARAARVERAEALRERAHSVVDKTRGLITLEAEDMFLRWEGAARKLPGSRTAARQAREVAEATLKDFLGSQKVDYKEVLESAVIAAQAGAEFNEVRLQLLLTLAGLERVTAGGFRAGLECFPEPKQP